MTTKAAEQIKAECAAMRDRLIRENHDAPADTLIRAIFATCSNVRDDEDAPAPGQDGPVLSEREALERWYEVDELRLVFDFGPTPHSKPGYCDGWVHLIHQQTFALPKTEDISDYTENCEEVPALAEVLNRPDDQWPLRFTT